MIFVLRFSHVCCFCPAGFDNEDSDEEEKDWKSLTKNLLFESFAGQVPRVSEEGQICDWYWGNDEGETGYWDRLTGEAGDKYWNCYAYEKSKLIEKHGPDTVSDWPEDVWHRKRLVIDKRCVSPALCIVERSEKGWCSTYYAEKVMLDCGPDDGYRIKYCAKVCPPQDKSKQEDEKMCKDPSQQDDKLFEKFSEAGPRPSKCPVIRTGVFIKNKAAEVGRTALKLLSSFMPSLLMPPEPVSTAAVSTSPVLPAPVSVR